jgi:hypothetical protein
MGRILLRWMVALAIPGLLVVGLSGCGGEQAVESESELAPSAAATESEPAASVPATTSEEDQWAGLTNEQRAYTCTTRDNASATDWSAYLDEVCPAGQSALVESEETLSLETAAWALAIYEDRVVNSPKSTADLGADQTVKDSVCSMSREQWVEPIVRRWRDDPTVLKPSEFVWEGVAYVPDEAFVHYSVSLQWQELCAPGEPVDPPIL